MDFRPPQPPRGVAFGYVLPTPPREALVEYTEFSRNPLTTAQYEAALADYAVLLGLPAYDVVGAEQGAIPITDAPFPRKVGPQVFRHLRRGAAQRQAAGVVAALRDGRDPCPPAAYSRRHLWMDALCCGRWTTAPSTGRPSSPPCSSGTRPNGCSVFSTGRPRRARTRRHGERAEDRDDADCPASVRIRVVGRHRLVDGASDLGQGGRGRPGAGRTDHDDRDR
jgi:hypothetical protein